MREKPIINWRHSMREWALLWRLWRKSDPSLAEQCVQWAITRRDWDRADRSLNVANGGTP